MKLTQQPVQERRITWTKDNADLLAGYRDEPRIDLGRILQAVRRQLPIVVGLAGVGAVLAVLLILGSVPRYTAVETVLLDEERADLLNAVSPLPSATRSDTAVQSEIEIIKSRVLAYRVVDLLKLDQDADFLAPPLGATERIQNAAQSVTNGFARLLSPAPPPRPAASGPTDASPAPAFDLTRTDRDRAADLLRERLTAQRSGRSLVIEIAYRDFDPYRAALIARGYGTAYEGFQLENSTAVAGTAEDWLRSRIAILERQSIEAAAAVQRFRTENNLEEVRGNLLTEQQQSELASALVAASAETAGAEARLSSLEALLTRARAGETVITVPLAEGQLRTRIEEIRSQFLDAEMRHGRLAEQFGREHPQVQELSRTMGDLRRSIEVELEQAIVAARVTFDIADSRTAALRQDLESTTDGSETGVALRGQLEQLEAIAETYAQVYRDYLSRLELTMEQQGFPIAAVKIISPADIPKGASSPRKKAMLAAGLFLGGLLGAVIGAVRELWPKPVRTASTLREEVGVRCAGLLEPLRSLDHALSQGPHSRTLDRLVQACEMPLQSSGGRIVALAPVVAEGADDDLLPIALAERISDGGRKRVLIVTEDDAGIDTSGSNVEAGPLRKACEIVGTPDDSKPGWAEKLVKTLRAEYDIVLFVMRPIAGAARSDPHSWAFDLTILRLPWGRLLPGFISDALQDHPRFRERLATSVLENANLSVARRYMVRGSYEERQTHA